MTKEEIKTKALESLGTASMCWSKTPKGVFDSNLATKTGDELMIAIEEYKLSHSPVTVTDEMIEIEAIERYRNRDDANIRANAFIAGATFVCDNLIMPKMEEK